MKRVLPFAFCILLLEVPSFCQLDRGMLTGSVTDPSGAAIPAVNVTVQNTATNARYDTKTTVAGQYTMPNLPPGPYQITFEAGGFKKLVRGNIELHVTEVVRVDVTMEVGAVAESVQITAETPRIQTDSAEVGTSLPTSQLVDLPLSFSSGRYPEDFAYKISPGVSGSSWTSHINGSSAFSKETLLDGATVTTYLAGHYGESSNSVEAIEEFKIQTSGMSAEFGRSQGGVFNFVMKSGNNQLHGSGFYGLRNEFLNANTFTNKFAGIPRGRDRKTDYAGSFGAPVYVPKVYNGKNRTFFYVAYERFKTRTWGQGAPSRTVPQPEFYDGDFSRLLGAATGQTDALGNPVYRGAIYDPNTFSQLSSGRYSGQMFPGNKIPAARFSTISQKLDAIAKQYYLPTVKDPNGQYSLTSNATFPNSTTPEFDQYQFSVKGDQNISSAQKLSGSYSLTVRPRLLLDAGGMWNFSEPDGGPLSKARRQRIKSQLVRLAHDWTATPTVLNHFNIYYNRMINPNVGVHAGTDGAKQLGIQGLTTYGFPTVNWGGGPIVGLDTPGDTQNDLSLYMGWGLLDTVSMTHGRHFMKAGVDFRRNHLNTRPTQGGSFTFNARATSIPNETYSGNLTGYSFASYLLGIVDSAGPSDPLGLGGRRTYYALYFQDDFKVNSRLTLNLGLRWDYQAPFTEVGNRFTNWSPLVRDPLSGLMGAYEFAGDCTVCTGRRYFGTRDFKEFGPRIAFAWRPIGNWTIRGAYGIFYEGDLFDSYSPVPTQTFPWRGTYSLSADPIFPWKGIFNWDSGFPQNRYTPPSFDRSWADNNSASMIDPRYGLNPYVQMWNLNVQREIGKGLVIDVGYVANKGTRLRNDSLQRINQLPSSVLTQYGTALSNPVRNAAEAAANKVAYPYAGYSGTVAGALRQFPQLRGTTTVGTYGAPLGFSTFHSLQITVNKQISKGVTAYGNYVWSKDFSNTENSGTINSNSGPMDYYNLRIEKTVSSFDTPHVVKAYINAELPFGRGKMMFDKAPKALNAVIGGWSVSVIANYSSGSPIGFSGASSPYSAGWNGGQRVNVAAGDMKMASFDKSKFDYANRNTAAVDKYVNTSLFSDPAPFTFGNAAIRYTQIRGFGTVNEDVGIQKNHRIGEKYRIQFRAEFLNALNRHNLGGIDTNIKSTTFGQVRSVSGNRTGQLGIRFDY